MDRPRVLLDKYPSKKDLTSTKTASKTLIFLCKQTITSTMANFLPPIQWLKNGDLELRNPASEKIYCKVDSQGYFPELIFYKDLIDVRKKIPKETSLD